MKTGKKLNLCLLLLIAFTGSVAAQELITNVYGRDIHSLNGKWNAIIDLYDQGQRMKIYENQQPKGNIDFYEYAFEGGLRLNVPGDWNSQSPELKYYEGTVWYARHFDAKRLADKRQFLYFGAVSYRCKVYLNGKEIAEHEGGFTPFQVEVTDLLKDGDNFLAIEVNNRRTKDAIPAMAFDWWNYGGITRDVLLVKTPRTFIEDYFIQLDKESPNRIIAKVGNCIEREEAATLVAGRTETLWRDCIFKYRPCGRANRLPQYHRERNRYLPEREADIYVLYLFPRRNSATYGACFLGSRCSHVAE